MMPGMSGGDLVRRMRVQNPDLKAIMITGLADDRVEQEARELELDAFLHKPMTTKDFQDAVTKALQLSTPKPMGTTFPSGMAEKEIPVERLSEVLAELHRRLGAQAVLLFNEHGKEIGRDGDLPDDKFETEWVARLLAAIRSSIKISGWMRENLLENVIVFRGKSFHILVAPVVGYALFLVLRTGRSDLRMALALEEVMAAQNEFTTLLTGVPPEEAQPEPEKKPGKGRTKPLPGQPSTERKEEAQAAVKAPEKKEAPLPEPKVKDKGGEELAALLQSQTLKPKAEDADAFWDTAIKKNVSLEDAEGLSYEQAKKLGLAPKEGDEPKQ
jgi:hypothetical protein